MNPYNVGDPARAERSIRHSGHARHTQPRFRREGGSAVAGCGVALTYSAVLRTMTADRTWLVGLLLLGVAVLVLGLCVAFVRRSSTDLPVGEPLDLPGAVRDRSRPRKGLRTPLHEVVRHPAREYPQVRRMEDATTVVLQLGAGETELLASANRGWS